MSDDAPTRALPATTERPPLRRSTRDRVVGGVCGGLGQYFGIDPVLLRIAAVALALSGGVGILAYIVAWIAIPEADPAEELTAPRAAPSSGTVVVGAVLVGLGLVLLVRELLPWLDEEILWPALIIVIGAVVLVTARRRSS